MPCSSWAIVVGVCEVFPMPRSQDGRRCEEPSSLRPYVERPIRKYAARGISFKGEPATNSDECEAEKKDEFARNSVAHSSTLGEPSLEAQDNAAKLPRPCPGRSRAAAPIGKPRPGERTRWTRAQGRQIPNTSVFKTLSLLASVARHRWVHTLILPSS